MTATLLDDATQARVVAAYLKNHPDSSATIRSWPRD